MLSRGLILMFSQNAYVLFELSLRIVGCPKVDETS